MKVIAGIFGLLSLFASFGIFVGSQSAIHGILAAIFFLISVVIFSALGIIHSIEELTERATKAIETSDQNHWTINKAIWKELREPGNADPSPKADGDYANAESPESDIPPSHSVEKKVEAEPDEEKQTPMWVYVIISLMIVGAVVIFIARRS